MRIILIFISLIFFACNLDQQGPEKLNIQKMGLEVEIIPESPDGWYYISWKDTLGANYKTIDNRPYELYCYIENFQKDTLGYYHGLSSPQQFAYFQIKEPTDSIVSVKFSVGINHFSQFLSKQNQTYIDQFNKNSLVRIEFKSKQFNLKQATRKKIRLELENINN